MKGATNQLRRFGFITTKTITQNLSRKIIEQCMLRKDNLSLVYAIPNHPWIKGSDRAAVRIAMTVAEKGKLNGILATVYSEKELASDTPHISLSTRLGEITPILSIGVNLTLTVPLLANAELSVKGFELGTQELILDNHAANNLIRREPKSQRFLFSYYNGNDFKNGRSSRYVIDTFPQNWSQLIEFPVLSNYLLEHVRSSRNPNADAHVLNTWWQFRRTGEAIRTAIKNIPYFIATTRTSKHRFFAFLSSECRAESKTVIVASKDAYFLSMLSSRVHVKFSIEKGGRQGVGNDPVYQHTDTFDPFPFPLAADPTITPNSPHFTQRERLRDLGERLDAFRKERLAEHAFLTMTGLYNALERLREVEHGYGPPLTESERDVHRAGLVSVLKEIHDDIDRAVFAAYGWDDLAPALVGRPGATLPSPHKSPEQERAEEELLSRLVALNRERAEEEKNGLVRWLRPDYQIPRLGAKVRKPQGEHVGTLDIALPEVAERPKWPADGLEQIRLVRDLPAKAPAPTPAEAVASVFDGRSSAKRRDRITEVLETLVATGLARTGDHDGQRRYFLPR